MWLLPAVALTLSGGEAVKADAPTRCPPPARYNPGMPPSRITAAEARRNVTMSRAYLRRQQTVMAEMYVLRRQIWQMSLQGGSQVTSRQFAEDEAVTLQALEKYFHDEGFQVTVGVNVTSGGEPSKRWLCIEW